MRSIILLVVVLMSVAAVSNRVCHLATRASVGVATDVRQIFVPRWASLVYLFVPVHISKPGLIFAQTFGVAGDGKLFSTIVLKYWQTVRPRKQSKVDKANADLYFSDATRYVLMAACAQEGCYAPFQKAARFAIAKALNAPPLCKGLRLEDVRARQLRRVFT